MEQTTKPTLEEEIARLRDEMDALRAEDSLELKPYKVSQMAQIRKIAHAASLSFMITSPVALLSTALETSDLLVRRDFGFGTWVVFFVGLTATSVLAGLGLGLGLLEKIYDDNLTEK
jgi:hypothetical protein